MGEVASGSSDIVPIPGYEVRVVLGSGLALGVRVKVRAGAFHPDGNFFFASADMARQICYIYLYTLYICPYHIYIYIHIICDIYIYIFIIITSIPSIRFLYDIYIFS